MSECDPQKHECLKGSASLESPSNIDGNTKVTSGELSMHTYRQFGYSESTPPQQLLLLCNSAQELCET